MIKKETIYLIIVYLISFGFIGLALFSHGYLWSGLIGLFILLVILIDIYFFVRFTIFIARKGKIDLKQQINNWRNISIFLLNFSVIAHLILGSLIIDATKLAGNHILLNAKRAIINNKKLPQDINNLKFYKDGNIESYYFSSKLHLSKKSETEICVSFAAKAFLICNKCMNDKEWVCDD